MLIAATNGNNNNNQSGNAILDLSFIFVYPCNDFQMAKHNGICECARILNENWKFFPSNEGTNDSRSKTYTHGTPCAHTHTLKRQNNEHGWNRNVMKQNKTMTKCKTIRKWSYSVSFSVTGAHSVFIHKMAICIVRENLKLHILACHGICGSKWLQVVFKILSGNSVEFSQTRHKTNCICFGRWQSCSCNDSCADHQSTRKENGTRKQKKKKTTVAKKWSHQKPSDSNFEWKLV